RGDRRRRRAGAGEAGQRRRARSAVRRTRVALRRRGGDLRSQRQASPERSVPTRPRAMTAPAPLAERIPPRPGTPPDELLDLFLGHVRTLGLELYPAQEEAILELFSGNHVILATPTGSGKSLVALAMHFLAMSEGK